MSEKGKMSGIMNNLKIWADPIGRPQRLAELGLTEKIISDAVQSGHAAWANCTENHPALLRGIVSWGTPMFSLREDLIPLGWERVEDHNLPLVLNPDGSLAITIATGDENTGIEEKNPSTKSTKGPHTISSIVNNQLVLFGEIGKPVESGQVKNRVTWILLFHRDTKKSEVRFELSLPSKINGEGYVDEWSERIIFTAHPFEGSTVKITEDLPQSPNINIDVKRRRSG